MKVTETLCRSCSEGEGNKHDEGIHTINTFINDLGGDTI